MLLSNNLFKQIEDDFLLLSHTTEEFSHTLIARPGSFVVQNRNNPSDIWAFGLAEDGLAFIESANSQGADFVRVTSPAEEWDRAHYYAIFWNDQIEDYEQYLRDCEKEPHQSMQLSDEEREVFDCIFNGTELTPAAKKYLANIMKPKQ